MKKISYIIIIVTTILSLPFIAESRYTAPTRVYSPPIIQNNSMNYATWVAVWTSTWLIVWASMNSNRSGVYVTWFWLRFLYSISYIMVGLLFATTVWIIWDIRRTDARDQEFFNRI